MNCSDICSIVVACITLIFAILTFIVNKRAKDIANNMNMRDIERYNKEIDSKARDFIIKYHKFHDSYINLLYECVMAYKFNSSHTYTRQMYNDFNILTDDVKNKVLEIMNISIDTIIKNDFINYIKTSIIQLIQNTYPDEDLDIVNYLFSEFCKSLNNSNFNIEFTRHKFDIEIAGILKTNNKPFSNIKKIYGEIVYDKKCFQYIIMTAFVILVQNYALYDDEKDLIEEKIDQYSYESFTDSLTLEDEFLRTLTYVYMFNKNYIAYLKGCEN